MNNFVAFTLLSLAFISIAFEFTNDGIYIILTQLFTNVLINNLWAIIFLLYITMDLFRWRGGLSGIVWEDKFLIRMFG